MCVHAWATMSLYQLSTLSIEGAVYSEQQRALQHGLGLGWLCRPLFGGAAGELHALVRVCEKGSSGILLSQV